MPEREKQAMVDVETHQSIKAIIGELKMAAAKLLKLAFIDVMLMTNG